MAENDFDNRHKFAKGNKLGKKFKKGAVANPKGPPIGKVQLWRWICEYMAMTDEQFEKLKEKKTLTQSQQSAVALVEKLKVGGTANSEVFTKYVIDREHGKAPETIRITGDDDLTDDECEEIRELLKQDD